MARRRSRGEGSVYPIKSKGLWGAQITLPDGQRKFKTNKKQSVVREWLLAERNRVNDGMFVRDDKITVQSFLRRYLDDYCKRKLRATTHASYKQVIEGHLIPELGLIKLSQLRPDQIDHLISKQMKSGLSDRYVEYTHGILKRALNVAVKKWELIPKNPALSVTPPKPVFKIPTVWDRTQVMMFLGSLKEDRWGAIYYLALTGMRKGEILGTPLSALDLNKGYLTVVQNLQYLAGQGLLLMEPKTENSKRRIKLPVFIADALRTHLVRREALSKSPLWKESGLVFTTNIGTAIFPRNMVGHFKAKLSALGLPNIRFQDLRHTVASLLFEADTHPKLVQELLGHSTVQVTLDRYSHKINPLNSVVADTLDGIISGTA